jgi:hypothetical protein
MDTAGNIAGSLSFLALLHCVLARNLRTCPQPQRVLLRLKMGGGGGRGGVGEWRGGAIHRLHNRYAQVTDRSMSDELRLPHR